MINYERIKSMSIDEMAGYFNEIFDCCNCPNDMFLCESKGDVCTKYIKQWLESEVQEMSDKNLNEWLFADMEDLIDCDYSDESEAENRMADKEIIIEKTFSEELPYFKERIKEVFDNYNNPNGNEDPLYICVLRDSNRIVRKAEEEITRQKVEIDELKHERKVLIEDIHCSADKINEQLEEIEKLERTISYLEGICESTPDKVRTEAIKEFVEKLKKRYDNPVWYLGGSNGFFDNLDNFVKEMVGDT